MIIIAYITVANGQARKVINVLYKYKEDGQKRKTDNMGGGLYQNPREIEDNSGFPRVVVGSPTCRTRTTRRKG